MDYTTTDTTASSGASVGNLVVSLGLLVAYVALLVAVIAGSWKVLVKAGKPGWAIFVPIYNWIVFLQIIGRPWWWILLLFVPVVNLVVSILISLELAHAFGKSSTFGIVGLFFFGFVGIPMLGFGSAKYVGPDAPPAATPQAPAPAPTV